VIAAGLLMMVVCVAAALDSLRYRGQPPEVLGRLSTRWRFILHSGLQGVGYAGVGVTLFPLINPEEQFLLGMMLCCVLAVGATAVATVRDAALAFVVTMSVGMALALLRDPRFDARMTGYLLLLQGVLTVAVVLCVLAHDAGFRARLRAETDAQQEREAVNLLLRDFESQADDWVWEIDAQRRLVHVADRMLQALGLGSSSSLLWLDFVMAVGGDRAAVLTQRLREPTAFRGFEVTPALPAGGKSEPVCWSISGVPVFDAQGALVGWRGLVRDVTVVRAQARELHRLAHTDALTGLVNRHVLLQRCAQLGGRNASGVESGAAAPALFLLDLDNFKAVNDTFGHQVGDQLLQEVGRRLTVCVADWLPAAQAVLSRLGGDEFALLVEQSMAAARRDALAQALLEALRPPWQTASLRVEVRASIGVADWKPPCTDAVRLLQNADVALYEAKAAGRDTVRVFNDEISGRLARRTAVIRGLGAALEAARTPEGCDAVQGELSLHYQPQHDLASGEVVGAEALLRWHHPLRGWMPTQEFIRIAEDTGLIVPLGLWVLERACRDALTWPAHWCVSVNVSGVQLGSRDLVHSFAEVLERTGLPPHRLTLEITETALLAEPARAQAHLHALRGLGMGIALDDFGTGYSSLAYLATLPIDLLKIDRSFTAALAVGGPPADTILHTILQLGRGLGLKTLAEGVETAAQVETLRRLGCERVQGFRFSRPVPAAELPVRFGVA
jgi:diguanylate cyclase (GGDEF)-like protein